MAKAIRVPNSTRRNSRCARDPPANASESAETPCVLVGLCLVAPPLSSIASVKENQHHKHGQYHEHCQPDPHPSSNDYPSYPPVRYRLQTQAAIAKEEQFQKDALRHETEADDKKRKYNSMTSYEVTPEEMEAYRMKKTNDFNDPMAKFMGGDDEELLEYNDEDQATAKKPKKSKKSSKH